MTPAFVERLESHGPADMAPSPMDRHHVALLSRRFRLSAFAGLRHAERRRSPRCSNARCRKVSVVALASARESPEIPPLMRYAAHRFAAAG